MKPTTRSLPNRLNSFTVSFHIPSVFSQNSNTVGSHLVWHLRSWVPVHYVLGSGPSLATAYKEEYWVLATVGHGGSTADPSGKSYDGGRFLWYAAMVTVRSCHMKLLL